MNADSAVETTSGSRQWSSHRTSAFILRWAIMLAPIVAATVAIIVLLRLLPPANGLGFELVRNTVAVLAGFGVSFVVSRFGTRILPLAALMRLSLIFPDQAPSRFRVAMKASSSRQLQRNLERVRDVDAITDAEPDDAATDSGPENSASRVGASERGESETPAEEILALATAIGTHDRRTRGHSERVRVYSRMIGEEMGLEGDELEKLQWGALLHDMGKVKVNPAILNKAGRPDEDEWAELQTHPEWGRVLLAPLDDFLGEWASASWGHHERWDGTGYPNKLKGAEIPLAARIVAVADAYEVMTATRAYKTPMSAEAAREELARSAGTHFDPEVVRATLALSVGRLKLAAGPASFILGLPFASTLASTAKGMARFPDLAAGVAAAGTAVLAVASTGVASVAGLVEVSPAAPAELAFSDGSADAAAESADGGSPDGDAGAVPTADQIGDEASVEEQPTTLPADGPTSTTMATPSTTESTSTTTSITTTTAPSVSSTTEAPTTTAISTTTTTAPPRSSTTTSTTTTTPAPTTTVAPPPTTTASAPAPTVIEGDATVRGPLAGGEDLSKQGPWSDSDTINVWTEGTTVLAEDLTVGTTVIQAGTTVHSYYLSLMPSSGTTLSATIDVHQPILAVVTESGDLRGTEFLGPGDVIYEGAAQLEPSDGWAVDGSVVSVSLEAKPSSVDQIRIIVAG